MMIEPLKYPYIPLTDPPTQLDAVFDFCTAWGGPIILDYNSQKMVLKSGGLNFCTLNRENS